MTKFKTDADLLKAVNEYQQSYVGLLDANRKELASIAETGRKKLYSNLAVGYGLCLAMREPANANAVAQLLSFRNLKAASGKTNPFLPLVRAIWGKEDASDVSSKWVPNRSAEKYANVFRLAETRKRTAENFADWLDTFKDELGNRMIGAERRDRADHGANDPAAEAEIERNIKVVLTHTIGTLPAPRSIADSTEKYVCVWGVVKGKQFIAHGVLPKMVPTVERHLRSEATALADEIVKDKHIADAKRSRKPTPEAVAA